MTATSAASEVSAHRGLPSESPVGSTRRGPMQILLATDGSDSAAEACYVVQNLHLPVGSAIRILSVIPGPEFQYAEWAVAVQKAQVGVIAEKAAACVRREGLEVSTTSTWGTIVTEILAAAREFDADLIVLGSTGRTGLEGFLLGSVARNVAHHADRPVLIARHPHGEIRKVVLAVDGSEHAEDALRFACRLPLGDTAEVVVCAVYRRQSPVIADPLAMTPEYAELVMEAERQEQRQTELTADRACRTLEEAGIRSRGLVRCGDPGDQIIQLMKDEHADLVIAGARGTSLLKGLGIGSVADRLLKAAPASVLLVRTLG